MVRITESYGAAARTQIWLAPPQLPAPATLLPLHFFILSFRIYTEISIAPIMKTCHLYLKTDAPNSTTIF